MIVGHLEGQLGTATAIASDRGAKVTHCIDTTQALATLCSSHSADLLMVEAQQDIAAFIVQLRAEHMSIPVIACGIKNDREAAVRAIRSGAKEYIPLPPDEALIAAVLEAISQDSSSVLYRSEAMKRTISMVEQVAPSHASVLITGESGTGKEVIARHLHQQSDRSDKPFISVNCAAIPENLLESELFGHEKGAFTGALNRRIGKFEEAHGGTLLLDEISEMDLRLQAKLLRAIQEREFDRVGGTKPIKVDIRILATSNRDMQSHIRQGKFREDLYYRLNVITVDLAPLRERRDDILLLAEHFIEKYASTNHVQVRSLSQQAQQRLLEYPWPGNVRELENTLHRAVLIAHHQTIEESDLMLSPSASSEQHAAIQDNAEDENYEDMIPLVGQTVAHVEKKLILQTLDHCLGNRTHAANILGISIRTLRNKLRLYGEPEMVGSYESTAL